MAMDMCYFYQIYYRLGLQCIFARLELRSLLCPTHKVFPDLDGVCPPMFGPPLLSLDILPVDGRTIMLF